MRAEARISEWRLTRTALGWRLGVVVGAGTYCMLLTSIYSLHISPRYAYLGYVFDPAPAAYVAVAILSAWLPALWLPVRLDRPSQVVYWLLYVLVYVPSMVVPLLSLGAVGVAYLPIIGMLAGLFALMATVYALPALALTRLALPPRIFWAGIIALGAALLAVVVSTFGLRLGIPSLADIYGVRTEFKEIATSRLTTYSVSWLGNVLFPFIIAVSLIERRPWLMATGAVGLIFIYSVTGFRSVLLSSALLVLLLFALRGKGRYFGPLVIWGAAGLVAVAWLADAVTRTPIATSMFVRRLIVTPGILSGWYHDFFSQNPKALLGHSVLEGIVPYAYDRLPPLLIGREYFGREETYANANLWADAYANFGLPGMIGFTLGLMALLWIFDSLAHGRSWAYVLLAALLLGMPAFTLSNTALITSIATHGAALAWILLYAAPRGILTRGGRIGRSASRSAGGGHERGH